MAKKDCTELAQTIRNIVRDLMDEPGVKNLDDAVFKLQETFPILSREEVIRNILETTNHEKRVATEAQKKWRGVLAEVKADPKLRNDNAVITDYMEKGKVPESAPEKPVKDVSFILQELKDTKANAKKWLETADPAIREKMEAKLAELQEKISNGDVIVEPKREGELHAELQGLQDQIAAAKKHIVSATDVEKVKASITSLQKHLDEGTLPTATNRPERGSGVLDSLRNVRDELKRRVNHSEPAIAQRLEKRMADLDAIEAQIKDGTYEPPAKEPITELSKDVAYRQLQVNQKAAQVRRAIDDLAPKTLIQRMGKYNPFLVIRDIIVNGEFSQVLRQGKVALMGRVGETIEMAAAGKPTLEPLARTAKELHDIPTSFWSKDGADLHMAEMMADPDWKLFVLAKNHVSPTDGNSGPSAREETSLSNMGWKLPVLKNFNQAMAVFTNEVRFHQFKAAIATMTINGEPTMSEARVIANMGNVATGRGYEGGGPFGEASRALFSAQYFISRLKMLALQPIWGTGETGAGRARLLVAREYGRIALGFAVYYAIAMAAGAKVEWDTTSSSGLTLRFGRHVIDPLAGFKQFIVYLSRAATGEVKTADGEIRHLRGAERAYGGMGMNDLNMNFIRSKAAPFPSFVLNLMYGTDVGGNPVTLKGELWKMSHPITYNDIYHAMEEDGIDQDLIAAGLYFFGEGGWTDQPEERKRESTALQRSKR